VAEVALRSALKYYFEIAHIPMAVYENGKKIDSIDSREFAPDIAAHDTLGAVRHSKDRHMDMVFTKDFF
jgi:hypothetical protein